MAKQQIRMVKTLNSAEHPRRPKQKSIQPCAQRPVQPGAPQATYRRAQVERDRLTPADLLTMQHERTTAYEVRSKQQPIMVVLYSK